MSVQVKRRREAAAFLATFVGAQGELIVDTTNNRVQVHDGATAGGFAAAKLSEVAGLAPIQTVAGRTGAITLAVADVAGAAPLVSATLTGAPTAPTPGAGDNSTRLATTAYVATAAASIIARKALSDTAYVALATDRLIAFTALTASRTVTLPAASAYPPGATLTVVDESGGCSATNAIVVAAAGTDAVNGASGVAIVSAFGYLAVESNGGGKWTVIDQTLTLSTPLNTVAQSASGAAIQVGVLEQLVALSGASVTSTLQIPARAIVFAVSCRTVTAIVGAPSYGVGVSGNATQFGGSLGTAVGSSNSGVIGPAAFYTSTPIVITATSGSFTAGQVRVAIQYLLCGAPAS